MLDSNLPSQLRAALARVGGRGRGRRYPKRLQLMVVDHYRLRSSQGLSDGAIAVEVGIPWKTIQRWHEQLPAASITRSPLPAFEPVQIVDSTAPALKRTFVVRGPAGLCIEGLDLDALTELVRRLS